MSAQKEQPVDQQDQSIAVSKTSIADDESPIQKEEKAEGPLA